MQDAVGRGGSTMLTGAGAAQQPYYRGTVHAFSSIVRQEGASALYQVLHFRGRAAACRLQVPQIIHSCLPAFFSH